MFSPSVLVTEEEERGALELTFDLPQSPLLRLSHVLLLVFQSPPKGEDLELTFSSASLQPHTQVTKGHWGIMHKVQPMICVDCFRYSSDVAVQNMADDVVDEQHLQTFPTPNVSLLVSSLCAFQQKQSTHC